MVFDHYLAVATWSPEFISPAARVRKTLAWIRIPGLNVAFYDESYLMSAARVIGKPVRLDKNTLKAERGRFARICVELNLDKPVVGRICLEDYWYKIEYEGLHVICSKCGCYGHWARECKGVKSAEPEVVPDSQEGIAPTVVEAAGGATTPIASPVGPMNPQDTQNPSQVAIESEKIACNTGGAGGNSQIGKINGNGYDESDVNTHGEWMAVKRKNRKKKQVLNAAINVVNDQVGKKKSSNGKQHYGKQGGNKGSAGIKILTRDKGNLSGNQGDPNGTLIAFGKERALGGFKAAFGKFNNQPSVFQFGSTSGPLHELIHNKKRCTREEEWDHGGMLLNSQNLLRIGENPHSEDALVVVGPRVTKENKNQGINV